MKRPAIFLALSALLLFGLDGASYSQTPFYQGKTLTVIQGREPGGTGDMRIRSLFPFLKKYIPGQPNIVTEYMPGGGGRKTTNHIYRGVKPDGLTIGNVGVGLVANAVLGEPGVQYDIDKLIYLGSPNRGNQYILFSVAKLGLDSLEKFRAYRGLRIGAQTVGHDLYINGRLFAWLLELKEARFVTGFSGPEMDIALMQGELDARTGDADTILVRTPEFVEKRLVHFQAVIEIPKGEKHPRFANLPEIESFAKSEKERRLLAMFRTFRSAGSPFILPPGTPKERVQILREAIQKTLKDPGFHKEYRKLTGDDPAPLMAEQQEKLIREIPREREIIELFHKLAGGEPLPPR